MCIVHITFSQDKEPFTKCMTLNHFLFEGNKTKTKKHCEYRKSNQCPTEKWMGEDQGPAKQCLSLDSGVQEQTLGHLLCHRNPTCSGKVKNTFFSVYTPSEVIVEV